MTMLESQWRTGAFCPLEVPRFIADEMLQGAGQWLRVAGYDTALPVNGTGIAIFWRGRSTRTAGW